MIDSFYDPGGDAVVVRSHATPRRLGRHSFHGPPRCGTHGLPLDAVDSDRLAEHGLRLADSREVWACPRCLSGSDRDVDLADVRESVVDDWSTYRSHFENARPPRG